jgi:uncharacterized protein YbgA (DUF1722 family)/uncharacterized protein YbbK (DUF523 family)
MQSVPAVQPRQPTDDPPVRLGVSACLLGQEVRYDGGHKRDGFLTDVLAPFVQWVAVCPEEEAGFGTPREAMRLERQPDGVRLVTVRTRRDVTPPLQAAASRRVRQLATLGLDGYILKKDSPSCGLHKVKVYAPAGAGERTGRGLFAAALMEALPTLPVEDEGRLHDPRLRENFIVRVFAHRRLRLLFGSAPRPRDFIRFHTRHKLLVMAHSPAGYARLGRMVAGMKGRVSQAAANEYAGAFMAALSTMATPGRHANVLQHMAGYFQRLIEDDSRHELAASIEDYRRGLVPLVVPITLILHHARARQVQYLLDQVYLQPHPKELMLRNHV